MYHWRDGWFFSRQENGSVSFEHRVYGTEKNSMGDIMYTIDAKGNIPVAEWASIVAAMTAQGETESREAVLDLHWKGAEEIRRALG